MLSMLQHNLDLIQNLNTNMFRKKQNPKTYEYRH